MEKKPHISDYLDIEPLKMLFESLSTEYKDVVLSLVDLDENILIAINFQDICAQYHRVNHDTEKLCIKCNRYITEHLHENNYVEYKCENGLVDIAMPVKIEGKHVATFYTGQCFIEGDETPEEFFEAHAEKYGFDKENYLEAYRKIPIFSRKEVDQLVMRAKKDILDLVNF